MIMLMMIMMYLIRKLYFIYIIILNFILSYEYFCLRQMLGLFKNMLDVLEIFQISLIFIISYFVFKLLSFIDLHHCINY